MSFLQLVSKFPKPNIAATAVGVTFSTIFLFGNVSIATMGVLPYVTSTSRGLPASERLNGWYFNYSNGKKYFGPCALLGALSYTAAATLSSKHLRAPLWVAASCCYGVGVWTMVVMKDTNQTLVNEYTYLTSAGIGAHIHEADVTEWISTWKWMNSVRIGMVTVAHGAGMAALLLAM